MVVCGSYKGYVCLLLSLLLSAAEGRKCTNNDKGFFLELWKTEGSIDAVAESMFDGEPFQEAVSSSISFNQLEHMVWPPFKQTWPIGTNFDNFVLRASARVCTCEDLSLLLYMSSDDGSVLFVDKEEHPVPVMSMNRQQSVTASLSKHAVDFTAGVCKSIEIHYFEVEDNQFLNLDYWQVWPKPARGNIRRKPLADYVYLPRTKSDCEADVCDVNPDEPSADENGQENDKEIPSIETPIPDDAIVGNALE